DGATIETVEGLAQDDELNALQQAFSQHHALQCGYCTPGMLMSATALLRENPHPSEDEIRKAIQGNICRCTGYVNIVEAIKALGVQGVYGTLTGDEVAILTDPFFELSVPPGAHMKDYALAVGKARFVGEPVAAVVAASRELARDAAELVEVEYEPLEPLVDARVAQEGDAPILHDEAGSNVVWDGTFDWGDYDAAAAEADHVVKIKELHFDRFSSTPPECSGC